MNRHVFLHVGLAKTGSTAIQMHFHQNREVYQRQGISYPRIAIDIPNVQGNIREGSNQEALIYPFLTRVSASTSLVNRNLREADRLSNVLLEFGNGDSSKLLLSSELISEAMSTNNLQEDDFFRCFQDVSVRPILYMRRFDHWVESYWKQIVAFQNNSSFSIDKIITRIVDRPLSEVAYRLGERFGADHMIVRSYDALTGNDGTSGSGLIGDFLRQIGVSGHQPIVKKADRQPAVHTSLSVESSLFMAGLSGLEAPERRMVWQALRNFEKDGLIPQSRETGLDRATLKKLIQLTNKEFQGINKLFHADLPMFSDQLEIDDVVAPLTQPELAHLEGLLATVVKPELMTKIHARGA